MSIRAASYLIALLSIATLGGCSSWSTYPPVETAVVRSISSPTLEPVPTLMTRSVDWARDNNPHLMPLVFNLPEGTPADVYAIVMKRNGEGVPMTQPGQRAVHVTNVRVRGGDAEVDVVIPREDGIHELITLQFERPIFERWDVHGTRHWRIRVATPHPNYVADPEVVLPTFETSTIEPVTTIDPEPELKPVIVAPTREPDEAPSRSSSGVRYEGERSIGEQR